ncbi:MAG TPA: SUF system Fe-S cluster assembly protein [Acidobacteriota bacterium]|nr:SUF system Fe-S cluster assembly protein [Acidobacteriota bacterium]
MSEKEATPLHQLESDEALLSPEQKSELREKIIDVLKTVYDPEIPVDIYELGLIYNLEIRDSGRVLIEMTLTSPACPVAGSLPPEVERKVRDVEGVEDVIVELVWDPPWSMERMSEAARLQLGFL